MEHASTEELFDGQDNFQPAILRKDGPWTRRPHFSTVHVESWGSLASIQGLVWHSGACLRLTIRSSSHSMPFFGLKVNTALARLRFKAQITGVALRRTVSSWQHGEHEDVMRRIEILEI
jgi:hypothetical protein